MERGPRRLATTAGPRSIPPGRTAPRSWRIRTSPPNSVASPGDVAPGLATEFGGEVLMRHDLGAVRPGGMDRGPAVVASRRGPRSIGRPRRGHFHQCDVDPVSYTHLTLPTILRV